MDISNMKNMVVLKNLPSNIVDEAIVILKNNQKIKKVEFAESKCSNSKIHNKDKENTNDYIVNEAEMLISNYITNLEKPKEISNNDINKKYIKMKKITFLLGITSVIQLLILLIIK